MEEEEGTAAGRSKKKPRLSTGDGLRAFTLRLAKKFSSQYEDNNNNVIFSPLTIYSSLALVAAGARGSTLDEILLLLGAASRDELAEFARAVVAALALDKGGSSAQETEGGPRLTLANGVWHDKTVTLKPAYRAAAAGSYMAAISAADFKEQAEGARQEINSWVSEATSQLVSSILLPPDSVDSTTRLVLASAVYFSGRWAQPFARRRTSNGQFYRLDGSSVDAPFMRRNAKDRQFVACHDGFKVLRLPYRMKPPKQNRIILLGTDDDDGEAPPLSMCVFLPDARDGLLCLVDKMVSEDPRLLLPRRRVEVAELALPKFKLSFSSRIDGVLRDMGLRAAFDAREADLSDMCEESLLAVEKVFHKAVLEVDEEGTEAAASTAKILRKCCRVISNDVPVDFVADHPFAIFVVEEASGAVLFAGLVLDPTCRSL